MSVVHQRLTGAVGQERALTYSVVWTFERRLRFRHRPFTRSLRYALVRVSLKLSKLMALNLTTGHYVTVEDDWYAAYKGG